MNDFLTDCLSADEALEQPVSDGRFLTNNMPENAMPEEQM